MEGRGNRQLQLHNRCCIEHLEEQQDSPNYWETPEGINRRIDLIGQNFIFRISNEAFRGYAKTVATKWLIWITHPELTNTGPCPICAPRQGRRWKINEPHPRIPAHVRCVCTWDIEITKETPETAPKIPKLSPRKVRSQKKIKVTHPEYAIDITVLSQRKLRIIWFGADDPQKKLLIYDDLERQLRLLGFDEIEVKAINISEIEFWLTKGYKPEIGNRFVKRLR